MALSYPTGKIVQPLVLTPLLALSPVNLRKANSSPKLLQQHHLPRLDEIASLKPVYSECINAARTQMAILRRSSLITVYPYHIISIFSFELSKSVLENLFLFVKLPHEIGSSLLHK